MRLNNFIVNIPIHTPHFYHWVFHDFWLIYRFLLQIAGIPYRASFQTLPAGQTPLLLTIDLLSPTDLVALSKGFSFHSPSTHQFLISRNYPEPQRINDFDFALSFHSYRQEVLFAAYPFTLNFPLRYHRSLSPKYPIT